MKYLNIYTYLLVLAVFMASCGNDFDLVEDGLNPQQLPGYVAFNASGNNATIDPEDVGEDAGEVTFNIENPTGTLSDITVTYAFEGSAVYGTDFTIEGASASGGTLVIEHDPEDFQFRDNQDLVVTILTDNDIDGDKTLEIVLVSATNADGTLAVGRGGTDFLKRAVINISDIDCALADLEGTYDYTIAGDIGNVSGVLSVVPGGDGVWVLDDFAGGAFGEPVQYEIFTAANGDITAPEVSQVSGVAATITGVVNTCTSSLFMNVTLNCCGGEGLMWTITATPQ